LKKIKIEQEEQAKLREEHERSLLEEKMQLSNLEADNLRLLEQNKLSEAEEKQVQISEAKILLECKTNEWEDITNRYKTQMEENKKVIILQKEKQASLQEKKKNGKAAIEMEYNKKVHSQVVNPGDNNFFTKSSEPKVTLEENKNYVPCLLAAAHTPDSTRKVAVETDLASEITLSLPPSTVHPNEESIEEGTIDCDHSKSWSSCILSFRRRNERHVKR